MRDIEILKLEADEAFKELLLSFDGVSEEQAWACIRCTPGEYMHTEGSILSNVVHVAGGKFLYGSMGYRNLDIRWRDIVAKLEEFWPSWETAKAYLSGSHEYWLSSWKDEDDLDRMVPRFDGALWPSWKIISTVTHHDSYHAGQIQMLRSVLPPSASPPPEEGDLWRKYCGSLPSW